MAAITHALIAQRARSDEPLTGYGARAGGGSWGGCLPYHFCWIGSGGGRGSSSGRDAGGCCLIVTVIAISFLGTATFAARAVDMVDTRDEHSEIQMQNGEDEQANLAAGRIVNRYVRYYDVQSKLSGVAAVICIFISLAGFAAAAGYKQKSWALYHQALRAMGYGGMTVAGLTGLMLGHGLLWHLTDRRANRRDARLITP